MKRCCHCGARLTVDDGSLTECWPCVRPRWDALLGGLAAAMDAVAAPSTTTSSWRTCRKCNNRVSPGGDCLECGHDVS